MTIPGTIIYSTLAGSHAYGTNLPTSDLDIRGVFVPFVEYFLGFAKHIEEAKGDGEDEAYYEVRKFFKLLADCNPNIIELLFTPDDCHRLITPAGRLLLDHREEFISQKAKYTFSGAAFSHLKRLKGHHEWFTNPPTHEPTREEFGLPCTSTVPADERGAILAHVRSLVDSWELDLQAASPDEVIYIQGRIENVLVQIYQGMSLYKKDLNSIEMAAEVRNMAAMKLLGLEKEVLLVIEAERKFKAASRNWAQYQEWKRSRNQVRAELEKKCGYDSKCGMNLVRWLRMAKEILTEGKVLTRRPDAAELLSIRQGAWTYEQLIEYAEGEQAWLDEFMKSGACKIRHHVDVAKIDRLCQQIVCNTLELHDRYGFPTTFWMP